MTPLKNMDFTLQEWQNSNKRLSLIHLLIDEARKIGYSDEEHEDKISEYSRTKQALAERDELWRLYFKGQKDDQAKKEFISKIKEICNQ